MIALINLLPLSILFLFPTWAYIPIWAKLIILDICSFPPKSCWILRANQALNAVLIQHVVCWSWAFTVQHRWWWILRREQPEFLDVESGHFDGEINHLLSTTEMMNLNIARWISTRRAIILITKDVENTSEFQHQHPSQCNCDRFTICRFSFWHLPKKQCSGLPANDYEMLSIIVYILLYKAFHTLK